MKPTFGRAAGKDFAWRLSEFDGSSADAMAAAQLREHFWRDAGHAGLVMVADEQRVVLGLKRRRAHDHRVSRVENHAQVRHRASGVDANRVGDKKYPWLAIAGKRDAAEFALSGAVHRMELGAKHFPRKFPDRPPC